MAFYKSGESKYRPGVYMRFVNRGKDLASPAPVTPSSPVLPRNMLLKDRNGVLFKTSDGYYLAVTPSSPVLPRNMLLKDKNGVLFKTSDGYYLAVKN